MNGDEAERFKALDAGSYDDRTAEFDCFTERLTAPLADHLLVLAALAPGDRVLDVGIGTGVVGLAAARRVEPNGGVLGVDLSQGMLAFTAEKARRLGIARGLELRRMDAEALDLPDGSFDVVLSLFSLLHFPDPRRAVGEMHRVLRPGGRLAIGFGSSPRLLSARGMRQVLRHAADRLRQARGTLLIAPGCLESLLEHRLARASEPQTSALASHSLGRAGAVVELLRDAGFVDLRQDWLGHRAEFADPQEFWEAQRTFSSVARKRLGDAPADAVDAVRREFLDLCAGVRRRGGVLAYPVAACYVTARR